ICSSLLIVPVLPLVLAMTDRINLATARTTNESSPPTPIIRLLDCESGLQMVGSALYCATSEESACRGVSKVSSGCISFSRYLITIMRRIYSRLLRLLLGRPCRYRQCRLSLPQ